MADLRLGGQLEPASATVIDSRDLTTHGVIVGMTGSGKTGLGIILIEEALRAGIPTLLIDPKGDLTNLCLTFGTLAPSDFAPWVNDGDARAAGLSVPDFAATQAAAWTDGLASWGLGSGDVAALRAAAMYTIYTPGSSAGVGLNIVGSLQAPSPTDQGQLDTELIGDEIEGFVGGLLGLVAVDADPLTSREHILLSNLILHEWSAGRSLDIAALIGLIQAPPIRKLGVFELDSFFPPKDRTEFAMRVNGLLASPSFGAWMSGQPLDMATMLRTPDGRPRCAIVTTSHLTDQERQFATTLVLSKLITWMRGQSGTTDLRVLVYMDEVAGYLPPTAMPPTKKPIMTLMKQARAFGVGVVLSTQNPVDIDYKALSNAGTWMIGRLQTDRDKQRLLDGMSAAAGGVDIGEVGSTIGGLGKRQFVLRRAGNDHPEVFTTRWAMSYLRGPLTRDQIAVLMADQKAEPAAAPFTPERDTDVSSVSSPALSDSETNVMPEVATGIAVRWVDTAAPWLAAAGGDGTATQRSAAIVARVALRYDETKADLLHDEEYEVVVHPLTDPTDVSRGVNVDYDDRDLPTAAPARCTYRLPDAPIARPAFWKATEADLVDHLTRSRSLEILVNRDLRLYSRPGESAPDFAVRCHHAADATADVETAKLRDKYEAKFVRLRDQLQAAEDRADVLTTEQQGRLNEELFSAAGSILGDLLGGRKSRGGLVGSVLGRAGSTAGRRSRTNTAGQRVEAAENKARTISDRLVELEHELAADLIAIDSKWDETSNRITTMPISLERTDVKVAEINLAWMPAASPP